MKDEPRIADPTIYDHQLAVSIAGGSPTIAAELLGLLLRELPFQDEALRQAFSAGDLEELRKLSHKLHGSASYCGTPALMTAARELEAALPDAAPERITRMYGRLLEEIRRLLEADRTPETDEEPYTP